MIKAILSTLKFLVILAFTAVLTFYLHEKLIFDTVPGRWYLNGELRDDTTSITGVSFFINDSIKLVTKHNRYGYACYVYAWRDSFFYRTDVREYWDVINNKRLMIRELQARYEKRRKSFKF